MCVEGWLAPIKSRNSCAVGSGIGDVGAGGLMPPLLFREGGQSPLTLELFLMSHAMNRFINASKLGSNAQQYGV